MGKAITLTVLIIAFLVMAVTDTINKIKKKNAEALPEHSDTM